MNKMRGHRTRARMNVFRKLVPVRVPLKRAQMGVRVGVGEPLAVFLPVTCTRGRVLMRVTVPDHDGIKDRYGGACQHDQQCQDIQAADRFSDNDH